MTLTVSGPEASGSNPREIAGRLEDLLRQEMPSASGIHIEGLRRTSSGFSRENWIFDARWRDGIGDHHLPLILRRDPLSSPLNTDRDREFAILRALERTDVPAPKVYWLDGAGRWLGRPSVVMERVPGDCDWLAFNSARPLQARIELARSFTAILAQLQQIDWRELGLGDVLAAPGSHPALTELDRWAADLEQVRLEPLPEMVLAEAWLRRNAPASGDVVLVHGDYKPGNALIADDRITAVLDWETAHLGDPLEDLGWMTNPARRHEQQIAGEWERQQMVSEYARLTGRDVAEADLRWWNIFSCWRLSVTNLAQVRGFIEQRSDRVNQTPTWLFRRMFQLIEEAS
jgi:aminoglycoside phosphotransferase (APT) family kinase protein